MRKVASNVKASFKSAYHCDEAGHRTEVSVSVYEVDLEGGTYSWIGGSSWDWCDKCGGGPTEEAVALMRDDITRQVIWHFWPETAAKYEAQARYPAEIRGDQP